MKNSIFWKGLRALQRAIIIVTVLAVAFIIGGACILRWFKINFTGFEELATMAVFWLYMIGSAHGSYEQSQIKADILEVLMPDGKAKDTLVLVKWILTTILGALFLTWAWSLVSWSWSTGSVTSYFRIPMVVGQSAIFVGLIISTFYNLVYLIDEFKYYIGKGPKPVPPTAVEE